MMITKYDFILKANEDVCVLPKLFYHFYEIAFLSVYNFVSNFYILGHGFLLPRHAETNFNYWA